MSILNVPIISRPKSIRLKFEHGQDITFWATEAMEHREINDVVGYTFKCMGNSMTWERQNLLESISKYIETGSSKDLRSTIDAITMDKASLGLY
jgi:hypothetical protein